MNGTNRRGSHSPLSDDNDDPKTCENRRVKLIRIRWRKAKNTDSSEDRTGPLSTLADTDTHTFENEFEKIKLINAEHSQAGINIWIGLDIGYITRTERDEIMRHKIAYVLIRNDFSDRQHMHVGIVSQEAKAPRIWTEHL